MTQLNAETLQKHKEAIVNHWYEAIASSIEETNVSETKAQIADWIDSTITLLTSTPFKREVAHALGENLARDLSAKPAILGKTQEVLARQFTEGLSAEQVAALMPSLSELLGEIAAGFIQEKDRRIQSMRRKFLSTTSHDMRSPLNAIIGFSRIIMKGVDGPVTDLQAQDLATVYTSGQNLLKMIDDVFNIEKVEAGSIEIDAKSFKVKDLIGSIISDVQTSIDEHDNTLEVQQANTPDEIHSDPAKIKQILVNLLDRTTKFTRRGTITLKVTLATAEGVDWARFQISDTGLGMTPTQIKRFTQAKSTDTLQYDDIGLMVSQRLCQLLGGELGIESTVGKGTTYTVDLPVRHTNT